MTAITLSCDRHRLLADCLSDRSAPVARSARFAVYALDPEAAGAPDLDDIVLVHDFARAEIDNNIARSVAEELMPLLADAGCLARTGSSEQDVFERLVGDVVRSMDGDERRAWRLFYDNTLAALVAAGDAPGAGLGRPAPTDYIADFAAIYRRAAGLVGEVAPDSVLDVATCFGFLPLLLATGAWAAEAGAPRPGRIVACDLNPALIALADGVARDKQLAAARFVRADILAADIARDLAPVAPSFDVVTAIHLLEHLDPAQTAAAMDALWALTARRLIVAVPVEAEPDARFGHRQVFTRDSLGALGHRTDGARRCFEDHGAWMVIDRSPSPDLATHARGLA
ncbi:MAG: methyltransferase domain-containing protein [Alphaproteobacteria bacterium]|jgi:hypothetical protein|nr:methyltransferase domain-containing protein [Alphaproteobacteria bacterium]